MECSNIKPIENLSECSPSGINNIVIVFRKKYSHLSYDFNSDFDSGKIVVAHDDGSVYGMETPLKNINEHGLMLWRPLSIKEKLKYSMVQPVMKDS